ncbi:MAG: YjbQ family protein [Nitrospirae bacterium]|nr:YjbQ family protein [Nitrospirota bacterium]
MHYSSTIKLKTQGHTDIIDITPEVIEAVNNSRIVNGLVNIFCPGSTGSITTIEFEPGVIEDLRKAIERIAPSDIPYEHNKRWGDGNGFSHVRAALLKPSITIPVINGQLQLGTWQQIVFIDFDNRPRKRTLIVQIIGQ